MDLSQVFFRQITVHHEDYRLTLQGSVMIQKITTIEDNHCRQYVSVYCE